MRWQVRSLCQNVCILISNTLTSFTYIVQNETWRLVNMSRPNLCPRFQRVFLGPAFEDFNFPSPVSLDAIYPSSLNNFAHQWNGQLLLRLRSRFPPPHLRTAYSFRTTGRYMSFVIQIQCYTVDRKSIPVMCLLSSTSDATQATSNLYRIGAYSAVLFWLRLSPK